jgi:beta-fructofuranosidase
MTKNMTRITIENTPKLHLNHLKIKESKYVPRYHIFPFSGLINDPNGFHYDGEYYNIFFQWHPWGATHGLKYWYHLKTKDFISYQNNKWPLMPNSEFSNSGVYSGTARLDKNNHTEIIYTANHYIENVRMPYQVIAHLNNDIISEQKIIINPNELFTEHFRDPKVFIDNKGNEFISVGAQTKDKKGCVAIYSKNGEVANYLGILEINQTLNEFGYMWECPDITLDINEMNQGLFVFCPQGIVNNSFPNIYSATYLVFDKFSYNPPKLINSQEVKLIDSGFDFYAPQITFDQNKKRYLMYAWIGLPDIVYPTDKENWSGVLSLPRHIIVKNNELLQKPIDEMTNLISQKVEFKNGLTNLTNGLVKLDISSDFNLKIGSKNDYIEIFENDGYLYLSRQNLLNKFAIQFGNTRKIKLDNNYLEIFIDQSIIEIFANKKDDFYKNTMTSRFFLEDLENNMVAKNYEMIEIYNLKGIELNYDK